MEQDGLRLILQVVGKGDPDGKPRRLPLPVLCPALQCFVAQDPCRFLKAQTVLLRIGRHIHPQDAAGDVPLPAESLRQGSVAVCTLSDPVVDVHRPEWEVRRLSQRIQKIQKAQGVRAAGDGSEDPRALFCHLLLPHDFLRPEYECLLCRFSHLSSPDTGSAGQIPLPG